MAPATSAPKMTYRFLGDSGLLVSKFALGSWMYQDPTHTVDAWYKMMKIAFAQGVNFFDSAENYALGEADVLMGGAIKRGIDEGVWSREDLVVMAKIFSGTKGFNNGTPNSQGLNRKHLIEGTQASLSRMGLDYVDVIFCHHAEPSTPIEETVRAMNFIIEKGWALYWGTSNWPASSVLEACEIADRLCCVERREMTTNAALAHSAELGLRDLCAQAQSPLDMGYSMQYKSQVSYNTEMA